MEDLFQKGAIVIVDNTNLEFHGTQGVVKHVPMGDKNSRGVYLHTGRLVYLETTNLKQIFP